MKQFNDTNEKAMSLYKAGKPEEAQDMMHKTLADHCKEVYLKHLLDSIGVQAMGPLIDAVPDKECIDLY